MEADVMTAPHFRSPHFRSWAATHPGAKRTHNEDAYVDRPDLGIWAVADGAGGHAAGEVASGMITEALQGIPPELPASELLAQVRSTIERTHSALREEAARRGPDVMVASTVVVMLARDEYFACLWAGDSRAYLLRDGTLRQITRDHSLVQDLLEAGAIEPEQVESHPRANVITRAVGAELDEFALDKVSDRLVPGDRFLLCSDGLCKTLPAGQLTTLLGSLDDTTPQALIDAALAMDASDNVTAVAVEFTGAEPQG
jgi:serine/threonine-protein phosphatase Stp1